MFEALSGQNISPLPSTTYKELPFVLTAMYIQQRTAKALTAQKEIVRHHKTH